MFWYRLINFVILAVVLVIVGRKFVVKMFREHKKDISDGLEEAENGFKRAADAEETIERLRKEKESEIERINGEMTQRAANGCISVENEPAFLAKKTQLDEMYAARQAVSAERIRKKQTDKLVPVVEKLLSSEPYFSRLRDKEEKTLENILPLLRITDGDRAYLLQHDVLYVTLLSAFELAPELVVRTEKHITDLLNKVGGKPSFRVLVDPKLLGGLQIRIGDTVYDGTVRNYLYNLNRIVADDPEAEDPESENLDNIIIGHIEAHKNEIDIYQRGRVISVSDGICWLDGLADIMYGELVEFDCGERGMILDIEESRIGCVVFGEYEHIQEYSCVRRLGKMASVTVGDELLGRILGPLGDPIDGKGMIRSKETRPIECAAPGIIDRSPVNEPLYTGVKVIDSLIPVGKGQRELLIGDRQTGKSAIAVDTIINQKGKNMVCIYVAVGQKETTVAGIAKRLEAAGAMDYTIIINANAFQTAPMLYVAPYAGTAIGEYFMYKGRDVLIVYDDLSKHAVAYREMSLLLHRPSGREAYPGDVFYLHSRLLERSAHLGEKLGGGSMTALPIIETQAGDISAYIPTNVISITDGQIFLESDLFNEGQRPAVNVGLSVSRVGGSAQTKAMRSVSGNLRVSLAQYRELLSFAQFGSELDNATAGVLKRGGQMTEALKQKQYSPLPLEKQVLIIYVVSSGFADNVPKDKMSDYERELFAAFEDAHSEILAEIAAGKALSDELKEQISAAARTFTEDYLCRVSET